MVIVGHEFFVLCIDSPHQNKSSPTFKLSTTNLDYIKYPSIYCYDPITNGFKSGRLLLTNNMEGINKFKVCNYVIFL